MRQPKIYIFEQEDWEKLYLEERLKSFGVEAVFVNDELTSENIDDLVRNKGLGEAEIIVVFVYSQLNKKVLSKLPKLKSVVTASTGFDHIDVKTCKKRNVKVYNVPHYGENTVAEHAMALLLALAKNLYKSINLTKLGRFSTEELQGIDLQGKTLGVVGMGHIGMHVARMAKGFGMEVITFSQHEDKKLAKQVGFRYVKNLDELLKNSDFVSLHLPLNKSTFHILNTKNIMNMRKGSFLINTARGGLVDSAAIIKALDKGILAGAGLDVLEEEDLLKEEKQLYSKKFSRRELIDVMESHELMKRDNVLITPHNAFNTRSAIERILATTIDNIKDAVNGGKKKVEERVV